MNRLSIEKQILVANLLVEGNSIRSIERITGVHRDTIMRLGITLGNKAYDFMYSKMQNLNCQYIQIDEMWGFIKKKKANKTPEDGLRLMRTLNLFRSLVLVNVARQEPLK